MALGKDETQGGCVEDPSRKLGVKEYVERKDAKLSQFKDVGITREASTEFVLDRGQPLAFDIPDAKCQGECQSQAGMDPEPMPDMRALSTFELELRRLINRYSMENLRNTPDFLLAEYLTDVLKAFSTLNNKRERWYGRKVF